MIKIFLTILITSYTLFANSQNLSLLNKIKNVVQKEEYIALAINKYIIDTGTIPQLDDNGTFILDWNKILVDDYLGTNFNKTNSFTNNDMSVYFNNGYAYIKGVFENQDEYNAKYLYLYNYYLDQRNRVNTLSPKDNTKEELVKGSLVKLDQLQKEIVGILQDTTAPSIDKTSTCNAGDKFYEILNSQLVLKYCVSTGNSFDVYANGENLVLDDISYLDIIEAPIGTKAYVKESGSWVEYYYQGSTTSKKWSKRTVTTGGETGLTGDGTSTSGDNPIATVPGEKILVLRKDVGCMLVGGYIEKDISGNDVEITAGDISCWGDNNYNKFGVDPTKNVNSEYILTPVMLKTQLGNIDYNGDSLVEWNNSVHRIKYKSVAVNNNDVCAISTDNKLYCAGKINSQTILTKVRDDVKSVAMTDSAIAIVAVNGDLLTKGVNLNGQLGNNLTKSLDFTKIASGFKEVYSTNATRTFGAINTSNNLYIWGQRYSGNKNTLVNVDSSIDILEVFITSTQFVIKNSLSDFYVTDLNDNFKAISVNNALSASIYEDVNFTTNDLDRLKPIYSTSEKKLISNVTNNPCKNVDDSLCLDDATSIFNTGSKGVFVSQGDVYSIFPEEPSEIFVSQQAINAWDLKGGSSNNSSINCQYEQKDTNVTPYYRCGIDKNAEETTAIVEKTYDFGVENANMIISIALDMYEIDKWENGNFFVRINDEIVISSNLTNDDVNPTADENDGTLLSFNLADSSADKDELHQFSGRAKLDSQGQMKLEIGTYFPSTLTGTDKKGKPIYDYVTFDEASFGIDNILIRFYAQSVTDEYGDEINLVVARKDYICVITQDNGNSKLYCWGEIDRSIPILSTSLYNDSRISLLNNYFYIDSDNLLNQSTYDQYYDLGKTILKYPTYIGGFDYDFKFR